ncbi:MAG TPA: hypothetical protein DCF63_15140 [Planctomycetaceae bacterium]|nr:hypothetical protein [Planctomycetaceae bacterium]
MRYQPVLQFKPNITFSQAPRHGVVLVVVLITALLVSVLAVTTLTTVRTEMRIGEDSGNIQQAQFNAQAALNLALDQIKNNSDWREDFANGLWSEDRPIGSGSYNVNLADPIDGNLTNDWYQPVDIVAMGKSGQATRRLQMSAQTKKIGFECLRSAIYAWQGIEFSGSTINTDHWITSNSNGSSAIDAKTHILLGTFVRSQVAAVGGITKDLLSSYVPSTTHPNSSELMMPDQDYLINYYESVSMPVSSQSIPLWEANLLVNPSMEGPSPDPPTSGWTAHGSCTLTGNSTRKWDGTFSLQANNRATASAGPRQDISSMISKQVEYNISARASLSSTNNGRRARMVVEYRGSGDGSELRYTSPWVDLTQNSFELISGSFTPNWSGSLSYARLRVETESSLRDLMVDAVSLSESIGSYPAGKMKAIHRRVISPLSNPFAPGSNHPQGIYHIHLAADEYLTIRKSRIVGTLVVTGGLGVYVWDNVHWEPALGNYPALICEPQLYLWFGAPGAAQSTMSEITENVNLNPASTPYQGIGDSNIDDSYPVLMRGIVWAKNSIDLRYHPVVEGIIMSGGTITSQVVNSFTRTHVDVFFSDRFYNDPPWGFVERSETLPIAGSLRPLMD